MKKIIIFGTGTTCDIVSTGLKDDIDIVCYCDNNKAKWNSVYKGKNILNPEFVKKINFDYIVIASQFNEEIYEQLIKYDVPVEKIFQFFKYIDSFSNCAETDLNRISNCANEIEGIVTGISYVEAGIKEGLFSKNVIKMARHSQDLYFDYNLIKYSLENYNEKLTCLKNVIIGLSYYSFQYDMSLSAMSWKTAMYYKVIGKGHNFKDIEDYTEKVEINKKNAAEILKLYANGQPQVNWFFRNNNDISDNLNYDIGEYQASLDGNKNYPETVKENTQILRDYLQLLKNNNIKPIVVVCPVTKYYSKYFSERLKNEFYSIINEVSQKYDFQFLDYFNSKLFEDEDFYDVSHLNDRGAEKFTKLLNEVIEW